MGVEPVEVVGHVGGDFAFGTDVDPVAVELALVPAAGGCAEVVEFVCQSEFAVGAVDTVFAIQFGGVRVVVGVEVDVLEDGLENPAAAGVDDGIMTFVILRSEGTATTTFLAPAPAPKVSNVPVPVALLWASARTAAESIAASVVIGPQNI